MFWNAGKLIGARVEFRLTVNMKCFEILLLNILKNLLN